MSPAATSGTVQPGHTVLFLAHDNALSLRTIPNNAIRYRRASESVAATTAAAATGATTTDTSEQQQQHQNNEGMDVVAVGDDDDEQQQQQQGEFVDSQLEFPFRKKLHLKCSIILQKPYNTVYMVDRTNRSLAGPVRDHPNPEELYEDLREGEDEYGDEEEAEELQDEDEDTEQIAAAAAAAAASSSNARGQRDNRHFVDDNTSQKLSAEDIERLKQKDGSAAGGAAIIAELIAKSDTFQRRTQFSQQKYVKRKRNKYCMYVKVLDPTAQLLCDYHYKKAPEKIAWMRYDALAQLMTLGNVYPNNQCMLFETCSGLVAAAILERMCALPHATTTSSTTKASSTEGGSRQQQHSFGRLIRMCDPLNVMQHFSCVHSLNSIHPMHKRQDVDRVPDMQRDVVFHAPLYLCNTRDENDPITGAHVNYDHVDSGVWERGDADTEMKDESSSSTMKEFTMEQRLQVINNRSQRHSKGIKLIYDAFFNRNNLDITLSDSLIIATQQYDVSMLFEKLFPFLAPSGTFAIYCPFREPLDKLFIELRQQQPARAIGLQLIDTWTREYQILPKRSHPNMRMTSESGYILCGVKVTA